MTLRLTNPSTELVKNKRYRNFAFSAEGAACFAIEKVQPVKPIRLMFNFSYKLVLFLGLGNFFLG